MQGSGHIDSDPGCCWLCARPLGLKREWHHPLPRSRGGRDVVAVHPICHRTIHANFTNAQLQKLGPDRAELLGHPAIARFVDWVSDKPPDFHARTAPRR